MAAATTFCHATLRVARHRYATLSRWGSSAARARLAGTVPLKRLWLGDGHVRRNTRERTRKPVVEDSVNCNKRVGTRYIDPDYM